MIANASHYYLASSSISPFNPLPTILYRAFEFGMSLVLVQAKIMSRFCLGVGMENVDLTLIMMR